MADQVWPPALPQSPRLTDLQESPPDLVARTAMDAGPAKIRRRFTAGYTTWSMSMLLTRAQRSTLLDFFFSTVKGGALPFDWRNPVTLAPATFRFVERPSIRPLAPRIDGTEPYLVTFVLEELPAVSNAVVVPPGQPELPPWLLVRDEDLDLFPLEDELNTAAGLYASATSGGNPGGGGGPFFQIPKDGSTNPNAPHLDFETPPDGGGINPTPSGS